MEIDLFNIVLEIARANPVESFAAMTASLFVGLRGILA